MGFKHAPNPTIFYPPRWVWAELTLVFFKNFFNAMFGKEGGEVRENLMGKENEGEEREN